MPNKGAKRVPEETKELIYQHWRRTGDAEVIIGEKFDINSSTVSYILTQKIKQNKEKRNG